MWHLSLHNIQTDFNSMELALFLLISFVSGQGLVRRLAIGLNFYEHYGLSALVGIGLSTMILFPLALVSSIQLFPLVVLQLLLMAVLHFPYFRLPWKDQLFPVKFEIKGSLPLWGMLGLLLYVLYATVQKSLFWPVAEFDTITGYDSMAKQIANEGTFNTVIFQYFRNSPYDVLRFIYPPFTSGMLAISYLLGAANSKITMLYTFMAFVVAMYGFLIRAVGYTWGMLILLLIVITPEMLSHASLALSNLPNAICTTVATLLLILYFDQKHAGHLWLSAFFYGLSNWSRNDAVVFGGVALLFIVYHTLRNRQSWWYVAVFAVIMMAPFVCWSVYLRYVIEVSSAQFLVPYPFWDGAKFQMIFGKCLELLLGQTQYYGITFYLLLPMLALNALEYFRKYNFIALYFLLAWFAYSMLYYQIDYTVAGSVDAYIQAGYKRGMFNFVPLAWYIIFTNPLATKILDRINSFLSR